ncbi:MAG: hypothetical protein ACTMUB_09030 [cyanobacterium endosymbiont of Rhopalodia musculus]|uniref:hypothetical protein n=1 Tax=cyanobacterium endosymbiont of Epithemia clementina EcSB TaxID=3034674 RepID=UPI0024805EF2|nr:hypothetical protein [cyanobacterium endosymbiont of Epithemia clementina EcSB]WGT68199.1 hypothetical protein P3F56_03810 [cyanobacterium endosymbiont of Epithemia clementina EcSB]
MTIVKKWFSQFKLNLITKNNFNLLLVISFAIITLIGILNHAMWRDEVNGWLIARDSVSWENFFYNINYEGHPILWYICLWGLNQLTPNPLAMQIFHWLIAVGCLTLFVFYSPFTKQQKLLFSLGYFPFYEYALISRNYSLGILSIFGFCTYFKTRHKNYIILALILAVMANTNAYCLMISISLALTLVFDYLTQNHLQFKVQLGIQNIVVAFVIFSLGIVFAVIMLLPPSDSTLQGGASQWFVEFDWIRFNQSLTRIWKSYILVLIPSDSNPLDLAIFAVLSLGLLGFVSTLLIKKPIALFFYLVSSLEFLTFTYLKFLGSQRHYGHLYIILIASFWIKNYCFDSEFLVNLFCYLPQKLYKLSSSWLKFITFHKSSFLMIVLYLHLIAGIVAFSRDLLTPYSASRATANFIQKNNLESMIIVGSEDFTIAPISGYLNQKIYYPENQRFGSYVLFNEQRKMIDDEEVLTIINQLINNSENKKNVILILNRQLKAMKSNLEIIFLAQFKKAFIYNEKYYLYSIKQKFNSNNKPNDL